MLSGQMPCEKALTEAAADVGFRRTRHSICLFMEYRRRGILSLVSRDLENDVPPRAAPPVAKVDMQRAADGVTVFTVMPEASLEDLVLTFSTFMREGPTPLLLWDLRQGRFRRVTGDELRSMVRHLMALASNGRAAGRSAFVVANDADRGVLRTLITYAELSGYHVSLEVFRHMDAARAWLLGLGPVA